MPSDTLPYVPLPELEQVLSTLPLTDEQKLKIVIDRVMRDRSTKR